jgi:hypothetical protein
MDDYPYDYIDEDIDFEDRLFPWLADGSMSDLTIEPEPEMDYDEGDEDDDEGDEDDEISI